ncbi:tyrosine-type recombinase/integrase [Tetragenococcus halophilus]|uniref:tyrosine-type recombinase/integrase n=1 Tax=Tetragenococcus halophilus TaxID=51669 RepID=UPI001F1C52CC|nr:tyrosine-type recombinase/integrase [Tetragenococcus halophilus]MCF1686248.1 tyrosine-type recombinase/integrase [Tetragenococcus halophilus]
MVEKNINALIVKFLSYKRSLGYVYDTQERYLKHYQKHMEKNFPCLLIPDKVSTDSFLNLFQGQSGGLYNIMASLREFSRYLLQIGYSEVYIIPPKQSPKLHPEPPFFFSEKEISLFFQTCDLFAKERSISPIRSLAIPAEFKLLYCCGLRPKEARELLVKNVHITEKYIDIMQSKGPKSRRIYIHDELVSFLLLYNRAMNEFLPDRIYFFPKDTKKPYSKGAIYYNFALIWRRAFPDWQNKLPRLYDFRHHFAWANINQWAREKTDINIMLPYLMRYMGHNCIKHTLYYFRFVPDFYSDYKNLSQKLNDLLPEVPYE